MRQPGTSDQEILVADVKAAMQQVFPAIPLTLVTDGCDNQPVFNLGAGAFRVIVCDTGAVRVVTEGLFTTQFAVVATPSCFAPDDVPNNGRPAALGAVNAAMLAVPPAAGAAPQIAAANPP